jgi:hypothetical protein
LRSNTSSALCYNDSTNLKLKQETNFDKINMDIEYFTSGQPFKQVINCCIGFFLISILIACNYRREPLTQEQASDVKDSVQQMIQFVAKDISREGPIAWLRYFEDTKNFFMASDGQLVFANSNAATSVIKNMLVKQISKVKLNWSNIRIDPLTAKFANIGATWHENITDFSGNKTSEGGYFTAIAEKTSKGWQFRNAHWSVAKSK